jgi:ElaB/YqjD/DUF883 family membrane-anchored ribosome-binding protein
MDPAIEKELAALREEIESLRAETRIGQTAGAPKAWADDFDELVTAMQSALEAAGKGVAVHPIVGVAAAFAAGVLIGRLTKIG